MKKILFILGIMTLFITGCVSGENAEDQLKKAYNNMKSLDSLTTKFSLESDSVEYKITTKIDWKNLILMGADADNSYQVYYQEVNGLVSRYEYIDQKWYKTFENAKGFDSLGNELVNISEMQVLKLINTALDYKKVDSDISGYNKYQLTIKGNTMKEIYDNPYNTTPIIYDFESAVWDFTDGKVMDVYVTDDDYIAKIVIDMKQFISSNGNELNNYTLTQEFLSFNTSGITIPNEVLNAEKALDGVK